MSFDPFRAGSPLSDDDPQPVGDTAHEGTSGSGARSDHVHTLGATAVRETGRWEVIVEGSPIEAVTDSDETDWVYGWTSA